MSIYSANLTLERITACNITVWRLLYKTKSYLENIYRIIVEKHEVEQTKGEYNSF